MSTRRHFTLTSIIIGLTLCLCMFILTTAVAEADTGSSSVAFNSGGKGEVMVSCNGKTYKGEGMAACISSASCSENSLFGFMLLIVVHVVLNYTVQI